MPSLQWIKKDQVLELLLGGRRFNLYEGKHLWDERLQAQVACVGMVDGCSLSLLAGRKQDKPCASSSVLTLVYMATRSRSREVP